VNAIILETISEALLSSTVATTLGHNADATSGWKTEVQRLAQGAMRRVPEPRQ
jgi:hypothetical protein